MFEDYINYSGSFNELNGYANEKGIIQSYFGKLK